jgi:outer membrane protein
MKNISTILNIVLLVAVAVLYYLFFSKADDNSQKEGSIELRQASFEPGGMNIGFIDLDKLLVEYKLANELNLSYDRRKKEAQDHLDQQVSSYEQEAKSFQEKMQRGSFLNQQSAENQQKALIDKQQELQMLQMELENKLLEEQQNLNLQLYDSVMNYLTHYNKRLNFQYIFSKMEGGNLLIGDPNLDITGDVLNALNKRYNSLED